MNETLPDVEDIIADFHSAYFGRHHDYLSERDLDMLFLLAYAARGALLGGETALANLPSYATASGVASGASDAFLRAAILLGTSKDLTEAAALMTDQDRRLVEQFNDDDGDEESERSPLDDLVDLVAMSVPRD